MKLLDPKRKFEIRLGIRTFRSLLMAALVLTLSALHLNFAGAGAHAQTTICAHDVQFFGAAGSGENPNMDNSMGRTVEAIRDSLKVAVAKVGGTVGETAINYRANSVDVIAYDMPRYFDALQDGVDITMARIDQFAADPGCADVRIVLGGFSQGAMVMHRVLKKLEDKRYDGLRARIDGAILIADGDKIADDRTKTYGTAGNGSHGLGVDFPALSGSSNVKFSSKWGSKISSVCTSGDVLCSYGKLLAPVQWPVFIAAGGIGVHNSYASRYLGDLQTAVSKIKISIPTIKPALVSTNEYFGQTYSAMTWGLQTSAGRGCTVAVSAKNAPPGLSVSDNTLAGTPTKTGKFKVTLSMKSTCTSPRKPVSSSTTIIVTITEGTPPPAPGRSSYEIKVGQFYDSGKENCTDPNFVGYVAAGADQLKSLGLTIVSDCRAFYGTAKIAGFADWDLGHKDARGNPILDPATGKPQVSLFRLIAVK
nr:cutinase family protein [Rhodococcus sp. (in: high G+C Gram-positive bacteria)]